MTDLPVLTAERISDNQVQVWCQHCDTHHFHGAVNGPRVAHCNPNSDSPYLASGYIVQLPEEGAVV